MKSFGIGAAAALLAAWALPAPPAPELGEPGAFETSRRATGFFEWEGDLATVLAEREAFAFVDGLR